jgi:hypothetical protein
MAYLLILGVVHLFFNMTILHYFGRGLCIVCSTAHRKLFSFGTGVVIAYIITTLLPRIYGHSGHLYFLAGFVLFLVLETVIYRKVGRDNLDHSLRFLHEVLIFIVHFIGGVIVFQLSRESFHSAIWFFVIFLFVAMSEDFSVHFLHGRERKLPQLVVSASFLLGILLSRPFGLASLPVEPIEGIVGGSLLFVITREAMGKDDRSVLYFILGVILSVLLGLRMMS